MSISNATLGRRLAAARENCGLTQDQAAEKLGLTRMVLSHTEGGNRTVSTQELSEFAQLYRRSVASFLSEADTGEDELLVLLFRKASDLERSPKARAAVLHYLDLCAEGLVLEKLLGRSTRSKLPTYDLDAPRSPLMAIKQGEELARSERTRLNLGDVPIGSVAELLGAQGLWLSKVKLPDDISGFFFNHGSCGLGILVNEGHQEARGRFSLAHEYAHALADRAEQVTATTQANAAELVEKRANAFASALLLPEGGVHACLATLDKGAPSREEYTVYDVATNDAFAVTQRNLAREQRLSYREVAVIAKHFGASYEATVFRLKNLRILSTEEMEDLRAKSSAATRFCKLVGLAERTESVREVRDQVLQLALDAFAQAEISRGRLLELCTKLGVKASTLKDFLSEAEATRVA